MLGVTLQCQTKTRISWQAFSANSEPTQEEIDISRTVQLKDSFETGMITLYGSTGIAYPTKALNIPGHGWVPCSSRLSSNFTNDSSRLIIVHSTKYVTSNIWVTLAN